MMDAEHDFNVRIHYLHGCYLGRTPENEADVEQSDKGNFLAAIRAFVEFQSIGLVPEPWILIALERVFAEYLITNTEGQTHKDYKSLDKCMGLSRNSFRDAGGETKKYELAKRFWLFKWCFGLGHREIIIALKKDGYPIEIDPESKEAGEPERIYERTPYAPLYGAFESKVNSMGYYSKDETAAMLLSKMNTEARKYIKGQLRRKKQIV